MEHIRALRRNWPIMALLVFYIYLTFHALSGSQGLMSWVDYEQDIARLENELEQFKAKRAEMEADVDLLHASHLDLDTLDLKARELVFMSRPDEYTIWLHDDAR